MLSQFAAEWRISGGMTTSPGPTRSQRLKSATGESHDRLDSRIMALDPFSSRDRYVRFLRAQHGFHRALAPLYADPVLRALIPDLADRTRDALIAADLADLGAADDDGAVPDLNPMPVAEALGWLYVAEGSSLGAAFLLKAAAQIDLDAGFGARHLAGHADGRAAHWRRFTAVIDAEPMTAEDEAAMIAAARAAFARFRMLADAAFA